MEKQNNESLTGHINEIKQYVTDAQGLEVVSVSDEKLEIFQKSDGKVLTMIPRNIEEIIKRTDTTEQNFLQINFFNGKKLLLTEKLIGFKPASTLNLDMTKLPRVVTTPDLISVVEAIEDSICDDDSHPEEVKVLEKVYDAVLRGAEDIGFSLPNERTWIKMLSTNKVKASS